MTANGFPLAGLAGKTMVISNDLPFSKYIVLSRIVHILFDLTQMESLTSSGMDEETYHSDCFRPCNHD